MTLGQKPKWAMVFLLAFIVFWAIIGAGTHTVVPPPGAGIETYNPVGIYDGSDPTRVAELDSLFNNLVVITVAHSEIHEGDSFVTDAVDTSMDDGDTITLAFKTSPGTKRVHLIIQYSIYAGGHVDFIEGPTWDSETGTTNPILNRKREAVMNSSILLEDTGSATFTATNSVTLNPSGLTGGTIIHHYYGFGKKDKITAGGRELSEWILKPDTQYAIRLTADAAANKGHLILDEYEHADE